MWVAGAGSAGRARGDEGMWLFNDLPKAALRERHGFEPTDEWAKHVMLASVRFNSGGSASFVSPQGLVLTNHHVGADTLQKVSTAERNIYRDGFYARTPEEEIAAPDLELNQLVSIEDVTERVTGAVPAGASPSEAFAARRAVMDRIESESLQATGLRSDVVTLYGGGRYHLYRYRKYTDVRLVFAPEAATGFFGGDADNFEYPRYCLDICLFRAYENGKPANTEHHLAWSADGAGDGELIFVSGNPGRTRRIYTVAALKHQRDVRFPLTLDFLRRREILLQQYGLGGGEFERQARDDLFGVQNSRKAYVGMLGGLQNPATFVAKEAAEKDLRARVDSDAALKKHADAWTRVEEIQARRTQAARESASFNSRLYGIAETIAQLVVEDRKPSSQRLREFRDSARASLEQDLYSPAPIHGELEKTLLADSIGLFIERRGGDHPLVAAVLQGKGPEERASELIGKTKLGDIEARRALVKSGPDGVARSDDPLIQLARSMNDEYRRLRTIQDELNELETQAYAAISECLFAAHGTGTYPDATFTLRLAFGTVKGYTENGQAVAPWTTLGGAFEHEARHQAKDPWLLPKSWHEAKDQIKADTPYNFVCTADIIGGNSGSPVLNRQGEFVGIIFDGNIQSLTADYYYSDEVSRAVAVHSSAIRETLRAVYHADRIVEEIGGAAKPAESK
ncbi:MAG: S46 family peptidase [Planctomycetes bacterium]|nr:S46 family peptidase [Planctomycetota bacterium]